MTSADVLAIARQFASGPAREDIIQCLGASLEPLAGSCWPDVAWRFSRLTVDGSPVEFGISSTDEAFRVTFEVAGPEQADHDRLGKSLAILRNLTGCDVDAATKRKWHELQAGGRLRWGSWASLRCLGSRIEPKLYFEVPRDLGVPAPAPLSGRVRMIGFDPLNGRIETYVALPPTSRTELLHLLGGLDADTRETLLETLADLLGVPLDIALNWIGLGASLVEGAPARQFALFLRARVVRDAAPKFRKLFARHKAYRAWRDRKPDGGLPDHGILTFVPRERGQIEIRAGLSARSLAGLQ